MEKEDRRGVQEITIATSDDLLGALGNPDPRVRTATLHAIAQCPEKVSSLAGKGQIDLFQELARRREKPSEAEIRTSYIHALLSLDDDRVLALAGEEFLATENPDIILLTARSLAALPTEERIAFFAPIVLNSANQTKIRVAANLLAHCRDLPVELALQVAVTSDHPCDIAPLREDTLQAWLRVLQGAYPRKARQILLARQDDSFAALLALWDQLPEPIRLWAFREAVKEPGQYQPLIRGVIRREQNRELLLVALEAAAAIPRDEGDAEMLIPLLRHSDPAIRAATIRIGLADLPWTKLLREEDSLVGRLAIIERIGLDRHTEHLELLASTLEDANWRLRAAAADALAALTPDSLPLLQQRLSHPEPTVRAAAAQALRRSGHDWLVQLSSG